MPEINGTLQEIERINRIEAFRLIHNKTLYHIGGEGLDKEGKPRFINGVINIDNKDVCALLMDYFLDPERSGNFTEIVDIIKTLWIYHVKLNNLDQSRDQDQNPAIPF